MPLRIAVAKAMPVVATLSTPEDYIGEYNRGCEGGY